MSDTAESYIRWEPLAGLPEYPLRSIETSFKKDELTATAYYKDGAPVGSIRLGFGWVQAFKAYEEFSDPWMESKLPQPSLRNPALASYTWPFLEVINSRWTARVADRNHGVERTEWRHFSIVTGSFNLHVLSHNLNEISVTLE
jgi:hypothetical protein